MMFHGKDYYSFRIRFTESDGSRTIKYEDLYMHNKEDYAGHINNWKNMLNDEKATNVSIDCIDSGWG